MSQSMQDSHQNRTSFIFNSYFPLLIILVFSIIDIPVFSIIDVLAFSIIDVLVFSIIDIPALLASLKSTGVNIDNGERNIPGV